LSPPDCPGTSQAGLQGIQASSSAVEMSYQSDCRGEAISALHGLLPLGIGYP
jgi:hypothetical protein